MDTRTFYATETLWTVESQNKFLQWQKINVSRFKHILLVSTKRLGVAKQ